MVPDIKLLSSFPGMSTKMDLFAKKSPKYLLFRKFSNRLTLKFGQIHPFRVTSKSQYTSKVNIFSLDWQEVNYFQLPFTNLH